MANSKKDLRRKYFVNPKVQGAVLQFGVIYWLFTMFAYGLIVCVYHLVPLWITGQPLDAKILWYYFAPLVLASLVLLPIVTHRAIRFSHRFAGPMVRFRRIVNQLSNGELPDPIRLRDGDYWTEFASELNQVTAKFEEMSNQIHELEKQARREYQTTG